MIDAAIIVARLLQYLGATVLLGSSLFFVYALPAAGPGSAARMPWARPLLIGGAALLAVSSLLGIAAQASLFAGSFAGGLTRGALGDVVAYMALGKAAVVRASAAAAAIAVLAVLPPGRASWLAAAACGAVATASLAWMGHGAATEGAWGLAHLVCDGLHVLAAALWLGALAVFLILVLERGSAPRHTALFQALRGFSGIGSALVAVLVLTGVFNAWVLVGPEHLSALGTTAYGQLLLAKLALFLAMLALAALNRWRLTPRFGRAPGPAALAGLRRSLAAETAAGFAVLALVAWLGTLPPPSG